MCYNKKILIYINSMNASGGIERVIANLVKVWNKKYKIYLVTKDTGCSYYELPEEIERGTLDAEVSLNMNNRVQRIFVTFLSFIKCRNKLKLVVDQINPDYIYTTSPMNALEIFWLGNKIQKKMVISEHGSFYGYNRIYSLIKRWIYPKAYCISVPNRMDTNIYQKWKCNAIYVPHLVTYKALDANSLNTKILLNVGRLTSDKQQALLLEMWSLVENKNGWQLWIVGSGEERNRLNELIHELEVQDSVKLLTARKNIKEIYQKASFFALSSRCEGFGMVLLEAMSFGVPCISFDCPSGPRDVIVNDQNGFLVENGNIGQFVEKLQLITTMEETELKKLGNNAFETISSWNNEEIVKKWDEIYKMKG